MTRRFLARLLVLALLLAAALHSVYNVGASPLRDIAPSALAIPTSSLPAGATIDHNAVSDNADAGGAPSADGYASQFALIHTGDLSYDKEGRTGGYRLDFRFHIGNTEIGTEYLASIFPSAAAATAAFTAVTTPLASLLTLLGTSEPCTPSIPGCKAYIGPVPNSNDRAYVIVFTAGAVLVEMAMKAPDDAGQFEASQSTIASDLFSFANVAETVVKAAQTGTSDTPTAGVSSPATTATATAVPPTATPVPTSTLIPTTAPAPVKTTRKCPKHATAKRGKCACKKGYVSRKGKCVKKKH